MAGKIIADQIQSTTAGTLDTKYVVDGSAKVWMNYKATSPNSIRDSLNTSSVTDNATGDFAQNITNNFTNQNASVVTGKTNQLTNAGNAFGASVNSSGSEINLVVYENGSKVDSGNNYTLAAGDLA